MRSIDLSYRMVLIFTTATAHGWPRPEGHSEESRPVGLRLTGSSRPAPELATVEASRNAVRNPAPLLSGGCGAPRQEDSDGGEEGNAGECEEGHVVAIGRVEGEPGEDRTRE